MEWYRRRDDKGIFILECGRTQWKSMGEYENDILSLTKNDSMEQRKDIDELRIRKRR